MTTHGEIPGARDGHSACVIYDTMYIFGGYEEEVSTNQQLAFRFKCKSLNTSMRCLLLVVQIITDQ